VFLALQATTSVFYLSDDFNGLKWSLQNRENESDPWVGWLRPDFLIER
jgi:hypothetical protein